MQPLLFAFLNPVVCARLGGEIQMNSNNYRDDSYNNNYRDDGYNSNYRDDSYNDNYRDDGYNNNHRESYDRGVQNRPRASTRALFCSKFFVYPLSIDAVNQRNVNPTPMHNGQGQH